MSRTRGGSLGVWLPGWWAWLPNTIDLPFPDQVPLRSGIAVCACVPVAEAPSSTNAKTRCLICFLSGGELISESALEWRQQQHRIRSRCGSRSVDSDRRHICQAAARRLTFRLAGPFRLAVLFRDGRFAVRGQSSLLARRAPSTSASSF